MKRETIQAIFRANALIFFVFALVYFPVSIHMNNENSFTKACRDTCMSLNYDDYDIINGCRCKSERTEVIESLGKYEFNRTENVLIGIVIVLAISLVVSGIMKWRAENKK